MLKYNDVKEAYERIKQHVTRTPLEKSYVLSDENSEFFMKLECNQSSGRSYKVRGVFSKLTSMTEEELNKGVTAISSGNHGVALAYASKLLGVDKAEIFVPETTPMPKVQRMENFGATVNKVGKNYDEAHTIAEKIINEGTMTDINPCEDPVAVAGQGTVAIEILEQNPDIDIILVPIGGGGLITGVAVAAKAIKPSIEIIGVQTDACPAMKASMDENVWHEYYETKESICDALVGGVSKLPYEMSYQCIDEVITVSEDTIRKATMKMLWNEKVICEPSSATCYGAVIENRARFQGKKTAMVITGGNISSELIKELVKESME